MIGNLSKSKGFKGDPGEALTYEMLTPEQKENLKGKQGDKGDTPSISFRYDQATGNLYYTSDGILVDKEYVDSNNLATKDDISVAIESIGTRFSEVKEDINEVDGKVAQVNNKIADVNNDIAEVNVKLSGITADIAGVKSTSTAIINDIAELQGETEDINNDIEQLDESLAKTKDSVTYIDRDVAYVKADISKIKGDITSLDKSIDDVKDDMAGFNNNILEHSNDISTLYKRDDSVLSEAKTYADEESTKTFVEIKAYIDSEIQKVIAYSDQKDTETLSKQSFVNILGGADNWTEEEVTDTSGNVIGSRYGQVVNVNNAIITPNSMVNLQLTSEQVIIFQNKALAFYAENDEGVVTIYCIGQIPENDYTIQATVTEVVIDG